MKTYHGINSEHIAYPLGGIGAGSFCIEGNGTLSHVSFRHKPDTGHEPLLFSALSVKGQGKVQARVLEGPVQTRKIMGMTQRDWYGSAQGLTEKNYGLPRFDRCEFTARFPFADLRMYDDEVPVEVSLQASSPFIPQDSFHSGLPVAALEYEFANVSGQDLELVYSFHSENFMSRQLGSRNVLQRPKTGAAWPIDRGFIVHESGTEAAPHLEGSFCASVDQEAALTHCQWFRGGWFDSLSMIWNTILEGGCLQSSGYSEGDPSPGASLFVPFALGAGETRKITLHVSWYVPESDYSFAVPEDSTFPLKTYKPWYSTQFPGIRELHRYWLDNYDRIKADSLRFTEAFYSATIPEEAVEAIAANLSILKSPTIMRQHDGRLWSFEGCADAQGSCDGSCTHVWNYAQAIAHLFPDLERTYRQSEFFESQDERGHQQFRSALPIQPLSHHFHAAADGQLGTILKVYREWRISGDDEWLRSYWERVQTSLRYCIETWDPNHRGIVEEPHHNTYDIEFWGPDGMCTTVYLGALRAASEIARYFGEDSSFYDLLLERGKRYVEEELYNGQYFEQQVKWVGLKSKPPYEENPGGLSPEAIEIMKTQGPKYQYGKGCLSDGIFGSWLSYMCGVAEVLDERMLESHLLSVYRHNFKSDLSRHSNPQRPGFAVGDDGGLLLCTWPLGERPALPFVYSDEVWTGIEYEVASYLCRFNRVEEAMNIVRTARKRYDGSKRNPFDEYECGHWYARALASYGLLYALTGIRYDAVEQKLYVTPRLKGDFQSFLSTNTGYAVAGVRDGKPFVDVRSGSIPYKEIEYNPWQQ